MKFDKGDQNRSEEERKMDTVPKMISTKDLSYLEDMFHWNFTAFKQLVHFSNEVENEEIQELFQGLSEMHYQHMSWILAILRKEDLSEEEECSEECCEEDEENDPREEDSEDSKDEEEDYQEEQEEDEDESE